MSKKFLYLLQIVVVVIIQNLLYSSVYAQDIKKTISLQQAILSALENNKNIQLAKIEERIAAANFKQTNAIYLPQINLSYTALNSNNPLNAFGFKLQQRLVSQADFNPELLNHPTNISDFSTKLEIQQPILNFDLLYSRKAALKQTEIYKFKTQRTKEYLTYLVKKAFQQLELSYEAVDVLENALQTSKAVYKYANDHYQQGIIQKTDVLNAQVYIATIEKDVANAKSNIANASDLLSNLMGNTLGALYVISEDDTLPEKINSTNQKISSNRADFVATQKAVEANNLMIDSYKKSYLPKVNAFGNYQLNDNKILGFGANSYLAGIQISWNVFNGNRTKNQIVTQTLESSKLSQNLAKQIEEGELELNKTQRDFEAGLFEIKQHEAAVEYATEALRIIKNRYQQGLVNTTEVLTSASQLLQQKFALVQSIHRVNDTKAYIEFLTSN